MNNTNISQSISLKNLQMLTTNESVTPFSSFVISILVILSLNVVPLFSNPDALLYVNTVAIFMLIMISESYIPYYKRDLLISYLPITKFEYILSLYINLIISTLQLCLGLAISVVLGLNPITDVYVLLLVGIIITSVAIPLFRLHFYVGITGSTLFITTFIFDILELDIMNFDLILNNMATPFIVVLILLLSVFMSYKIYCSRYSK